jgi:ribonuclease P protein component
VRRQGKSYAHPLAVLIASPNHMPMTRVAFAAGKALGGAVARNRAKRLLRAAVRTCWAAVSPGWDLILVARPPLLKADWAEVVGSLTNLLGRSEVLRPQTDECN